ncbi:cell growth-regulating nucleolar protein-like [Pollicipes pollicipes]|uniref:cell growth-regulating nucleolar protein-like n=1 Tax=Pollicipes pollicipes TaxID=41117 RepID=UPI0018859D5C|nr:cell growth-regulating nucleolar protein-like [Pollicipes pollicipes]XP_037090271.1 cell growth-regulating nucleolar protein-like [Pollicipes pollicipes]XP_037090272.1 cell growth-regulating nucleolar protein-like [Pollicipes pollicipes]XP_037090273.1 cell growth-regulating nucleolar protein-like [Pollicipes pollicipes]XP_037090274.1 cell growth-regulating nucleolar protein-like [Pollicipes pollicipes]XP_037090275.1 cell growth-regulating nucleolar protein-like [Pollicipes pollicipes]XP_03
MVVFACNACGASIKKNQVEKHYQQQCRRCESLSCMDCGKDFWGEEYKHHNKCITEDEKYAAKGWQPKSSANKGERKQEAWIEAINRKVEETKDMPPALSQLLSTLTQHGNIPRKKKKFQNFVSNSVSIRNHALVEQAWSVFEAAVVRQKDEHGPSSDAMRVSQQENGVQDAQAQEPEIAHKKRKTKETITTEKVETEADQIEKKKNKRDKKMERSKKKTKHVEATNGKTSGKRKQEGEEKAESGVDPDDGSSGRKKKRKLDADVDVERLNATLDESALMSVHRPNKFDWPGVVLALLGNRDDRELPLKKLRKKVVTEYQSRGGEGKTDTTKEEIWAKLDRKLKKMPQVKVLKEHVKLVSA